MYQGDERREHSWNTKKLPLVREDRQESLVIAEDNGLGGLHRHHLQLRKA